jgi:hypothetical protein
VLNRLRLLKNCQNTGKIILKANERFALKNTLQASVSIVEDPAELDPADLIPFETCQISKTKFSNLCYEDIC